MLTDMLINGKFVTGEGAEESVLNPATGKSEGTIREASSEQIAQAVAAAQTAFATWSRTTPSSRSAMLGNR